MKLLGLVLFMLLCFTYCFSQAPNQIDNALLLDYYQNQRFIEAADYLKKIYPEPVTDGKALSQLAYTSQMAGRLTDAEIYYQRIYSMDTTSQSALISMAGINMRRGNITKAEPYYLQLIAKDTTNFLVYKQLANIRRQKYDIMGYVNYLVRANKLNPQDADVASDLSDQYLDLKQITLAQKVLDSAIVKDPENIILLQSLIKLTHAQKKWPETIKAGTMLLAMGDNSFPTLNKLGQAYYQLKNYECALESYYSLENNQHNETSFYFMGMSYKALKNHKKAIEYLEKAIADGISPAIDSYYGEMAGSYQDTRQHKKALWAYQKGLQFNESPLIYYSLALLYDDDLKDKANAMRYYKKYLATNPPVKQQELVAYCKSRLAMLKRN
ncbi:tetratricopeptide repeat protein [Mucilaginibacter sp. Bleaf8]|uniref:tetratricopeptide repeat protein n=1 Tax=Mucilaginibacter sp. Bleaf8 TaxID=2834430 RepID=UPI001BCB8748|nr:tetratricopeptide repeat protein [Mucilaginibacter sp. Bleaf8]MBS7563395.1 tetratricopeptide repeat protein [Mucilaginibacter sp. Bleaf8]